MSHPRLANKTALITAAGQGIGRASAIAMAEAGAQVCATDVNPALLESLKGIPGITTQVLDVMDKAAIQRVVASLPKPMSIAWTRSARFRVSSWSAMAP